MTGKEIEQRTRHATTRPRFRDTTAMEHSLLPTPSLVAQTPPIKCFVTIELGFSQPIVHLVV
eukprot:m.17476 g.17476  ORF g.17476 m.17476 type:complete len:62 (+) comp11525_c0_seq1:113-298(+)